MIKTKPSEMRYNLRRKRSSTSITATKKIPQAVLKFDVRKRPSPTHRVKISPSKYSDDSSPVKRTKVDHVTLDDTTKLSNKTSYTLDEEASIILAALRRNIPDVVPGRETHLEELQETLISCHNDKKSVSIYICGCPGTGKTITLKTLIAQSEISRKFKSVFINCMGLNPPKRIYSEILKNFNGDKCKNVTFDTVSKIISKEKRSVLIVFDEIDELCKRDPTILYSLFGLISIYPSGKIALIGVGNTLNFVNKCLPFIQKKPVTIQFPSYNTQEIIKIITGRLNKIKTKRLSFSEGAIRLLAAKVEAVGGDARMALGLASTSVSNILDKIDRDSIDQTCTVGPENVLSVWNSNFDTVGRFLIQKKSEPSRIIDSFPLHEKLIVCSILLVLNKNTNLSQLTIQKIYDMYKKVCQQNQFEIIPQLLFMNSCLSIEDYGIISLKGKELFSKVIVKWDKDELINFFKKETMFGDILSHNY